MVLSRLVQSCLMITLLRTTSMPGVSPWSSSSRMGGPLLGKHSRPESSATPRTPYVINSASSPLALAMMWTTSCWREWHWKTVAWRGISRRMRMQPVTSKGMFCFFCAHIFFGSSRQGFCEEKSSKETLQEMGVSLRLSSGRERQSMLRYWGDLPRNCLLPRRSLELYCSFPAPQNKAFVLLIQIFVLGM